MTRLLFFLFLAFCLNIRPAIAYKSEKEFDAEMLRLEKVIESTRPDVVWVNAEDYAKELSK